MSDGVYSFFVYGTLKKGQLRGGLWPRKPTEILPALIQADLYDLGPYPAAVPGAGWILGEIWNFRNEDLAITIDVLDRIEGYEKLGIHNEYVRETTFAHFEKDKRSDFVSAFAYFKVPDLRLRDARRIVPFVEFMGKTASAWPDSLARVPKSFAEE